MSALEFSLDTFGDVTEQDGVLLSQAQVIRNLVEQAVVADQVGIAAFGLGEHHRPDFAVSAPEVTVLSCHASAGDSSIASSTRCRERRYSRWSGWDLARLSSSNPRSSHIPSWWSDRSAVVAQARPSKHFGRQAIATRCATACSAICVGKARSPATSASALRPWGKNKIATDENAHPGAGTDRDRRLDIELPVHQFVADTTYRLASAIADGERDVVVVARA